MLDKALLNYIKGKRYYLVLIAVLSFISLVFSIFSTYAFSKAIYDFSSSDYEGYYFLLYGFLSIILFAICFILRSHISESLADYVAHKIRQDTYEKYLELGGNSRLSPQQITQLSSEGVEQLRVYYSVFLPSFFNAMISPIALFILMVFFSWNVAMLYLVCIPLIPISIMAISRRAKRLFATYRDRYISLGSAYLDSVGGMKELVIFHYDKKRQEEMKKNSEEFRNVTMKVLSMQLFSVTIMDVVAYGGAALGIIATLLGLTKGEYSRYIALFLSLIGAEFFLPMRSLGSAFHIAMNGATAGRKVLELLNEKKEKDGSLALNKVANVEFIDASYKYKDTDKFVLKDVNFTLSKGFTSLIGPSGSGKSTIAKLLSKNLAEYGGHIEVDGKELLNIKKKDYLAKVTYVSSDTFLLHKAIKEAFIFYSPSLSEKKMWELLNLVELKERIEDAGGLSYIPKEGASDLSGGEKQRLILAYYLAVKRDFYIFDETTSNIDKDSERIIVKAIEKLSKNSIVLFISHRLQNAIDADQVIVLGKDGRIVEIGTIKELVAKDQQLARNLKKEEDSEAIL